MNQLNLEEILQKMKGAGRKRRKQLLAKAAKIVGIKPIQILRVYNEDPEVKFDGGFGYEVVETTACGITRTTYEYGYPENTPDTYSFLGQELPAQENIKKLFEVIRKF